MEENKNDQIKLSKYLIFQMDDVQYAFKLAQIKEVIELPILTTVPSMKDYFMGILNLRGKVLSVIDLKSRIFNAKKLEKSKRVLLVVEINKHLIAGAVDSVCEVISIEESKIIYQKNDKLEERITKNASGPCPIHGVAKFSDRDMVLILDPEIVFNLEEVTDLIAA